MKKTDWTSMKTLFLSKAYLFTTIEPRDAGLFYGRKKRLDSQPNKNQYLFLKRRKYIMNSDKYSFFLSKKQYLNINKSIDKYSLYLIFLML